MSAERRKRKLEPRLLILSSTSSSLVHLTSSWVICLLVLISVFNLSVISSVSASGTSNTSGISSNFRNFNKSRRNSGKSDSGDGLRGTWITTSLRVGSGPWSASAVPLRPPSSRSISNPTPYYKTPSTHNTYQITSKPCIINSSSSSSSTSRDDGILRGTCMFVWECIKSEGKHLGMCIDGFMFGSCCSHNDTTNTIMTGGSGSDKTTTTEISSFGSLPFVTSSNNSVFSTSSSPPMNSHGFPSWTTTESFTGETAAAATDSFFTVTTTEQPKTTTTTTTQTTTTEDPPPFVTFTDYPPPSPTTTTTTSTTTTTTTEAPITETETPQTTFPETTPETTRRPVPSNYDECGVAPLVPQKRIVGGKEASFGTWPWIVSVRRTSFFGFSSTHRCGGTLINDRWVITAGHCVDDLLISQIRIRIGEWDFSVKGGDGSGESQNGADEKYSHIERGVLKKVVHGSYNFFTYENDLALLYLDGDSINYSQHIRPLCLQGNKDLLVGHNATVAGWGRLSEGGILPNRLQQVTVPIMSNEECRKLFLKSGRVEHIPDIFLCAGYPNGGRDSCQGDSGGPLQVKGENGRWFLAGIISWGIGCAEPNMPGVCTRISKFTEWILKHVT